ncbi:uncharacterized protein LOC108605049 [Drosophila busckii]|uniref:uncharacterized protein LOC108605049 n=1 Tax=Drosophila busckii TaxID=30019 RepID=UPI00083F15E5|nr:uncharacterized protein LOC108605049 [Drosophila busckii]
MKKHQATLLLLSSLLLCLSLAQAARRPIHVNESPLARASDAAAAPLEAQDAQDVSKKDPSSGRLFLKKFLMFKNMFGQNQQPVIPIVITGGAGTSTGPTSPTVSVTSTGTIPSATGTIGTSPTSPTSPTTPTTPTGRQSYGAQQADEQSAHADDDEEEEEADAQAMPGLAMAANAELLDEQAMQAALAAGAQEYEVYTEQADQAAGGSATESKASQNNRINLRRKNGRRGQGQMISVRIPPRYRRYFKNGQKVMLNTKRGVNKRRVVRRRVQGNKNKRFNNRRRGGKNKNKKNKNKKNKNKRPRMPIA